MPRFRLPGMTPRGAVPNRRRRRSRSVPLAPYVASVLRLVVSGPRRIGAVISLSVSLVLAASSGHTHASLAAPPVYPYEQAFREATIIVHGDIVSYAAKQGAMLRVREAVRGDARAGSEYLLGGSAGYSFLASRPREVTAFISMREGETLRLWQEPTSGGLIWSEPGLLERIARAHADPRNGLRASDPRERLAAAYYRATGGIGAASGKPSAAELDAMMDSVAWGMSHGSPSTHQAAVDTLAALGYSLEKIGINYHPIYKPEFKEDAAAQLRAWWARRR